MRKVTTGPNGNHLDVVFDGNGGKIRAFGILDPRFKYVRSTDTNIRKTFAKAKRILKQHGSL